MALILIMGIPGAGKTTLALQIASIVREKAKRCHIFSLDDAGIDFTERARTSRKSWENKVKEEIEEELGIVEVFVVDDIFYLASMRRPFERFARRVGLAYFEVHMKAGLEEALKRNGARDEKLRIPPETIRNIHSRIELPETSTQFRETSSPTDIEPFVRTVLSTPRPPPKSISDEIDPFESVPTKWARLDGDLRRIVSKMLEFDPTNRKNAKLINDRRREFFGRLKEEEIETWEVEELEKRFCDLL